MTSITLSAVREALKSVVAEFGEDYTYPEPGGYPDHVDPDGPAGGSCFYVHNGDVPGCLVAQVLHGHFKWSIDDLKKIEGFSALDIPGLPYGIGEYLYDAQTEQDHGSTWGEALSVAEARLS